VNPSYSFVLEDKVWLDVHNLHIRTPSRKLSHRRIGPYMVQAQLSPITYQLQLPEAIKINDVFHIDLLTPYHETDAYGLPPPQPPATLVDSKEEYKVEEIIDDWYNHRQHKRQYLIKWKGYPALENSWVDKHDLNSDKLLTAYHLSKR